MLSWYSAALREHGFIPASTLLLRVLWSRGTTHLANRLLPATVACPCCGWKGRRFYDYQEVGAEARGVECPGCNSHPRHRALFVWLGRDYRLSEKSGKALVFAPEKSLAPAWDAASGLDIVRTDIEPVRGVDLLADIQRLPFDSDSFDLVWCHHVLTQVPDDGAAVSELHRVLRPLSGELILSATYTPGRRTEEFARAGAMGFWRVYGDDFPERLRAAGLDARPVEHGLSEAERRRYGVSSDDKFFICTKSSRSSERQPDDRAAR